MSAGSDVSAGRPASARSGDAVPAFRVSRSTRLHLFVLIVSVAIVVGFASVPVWAQESVTRTLITLFGLVALAQMWNLLGGFAGLISVGQQAYIGIGAYGLWFFGDELHIHPFVAVFARRRAGRASSRCRSPRCCSVCAAATSPSAPGCSP